jgi:hydrogenase maturation factor
MTLDEAKSCICTIKMLQRLAYNIHGVMDVIDADNCKKIIKALEQEPCDDCISRQAVIEYIEASEAELGHSTENELVCQDIKELPPVTPQQKMGRWILIHKNVNMYICSECNNEPLLIGEIYPIFKLSDYCPNCGAKMEVEE